MGRPSNRLERRAEILSAFARTLAESGYAGATMAAVAERAGYAPGLIHHHFANKEELLSALLENLVAGFRGRVRGYEAEAGRLYAYADGALKLDERADVTSARCWVGVLSEAVRNPSLFARVRRILDAEIGSIQERSEGRLDESQAGAVLAFVIGALVLGAFAPRKTAGFAAPSLRILIEALLAGR
ncbi:MAG: TetR/AcrR family transcriptional regulator [Myxococcales bacterium]